MLTLHTTSAVYQFGVIRRLVSLDLEAEPDLPGVRFPQAAHTQGWSCSINAGPDGANTHCIHTTEGSAFDIGDFDRGNSAISCPTMQYCQGLGSLTGSYYENFI